MESILLPTHQLLVFSRGCPRGTTATGVAMESESDAPQPAVARLGPHASDQTAACWSARAAGDRSAADVLANPHRSCAPRPGPVRFSASPAVNAALACDLTGRFVSQGVDCAQILFHGRARFLTGSTEIADNDLSRSRLSAQTVVPMEEVTAERARDEGDNPEQAVVDHKEEESRFDGRGHGPSGPSKAIGHGLLHGRGPGEKPGCLRRHSGGGGPKTAAQGNRQSSGRPWRWHHDEARHHRLVGGLVRSAPDRGWGGMDHQRQPGTTSKSSP